MTDKSKSSLYFERAAVGFLLYSATGVTVFARSSMTWENLLMPVLLAGLAAFITLRYRLTISRRFTLLIGGFLALFIAQTFVFGSIHPKYLLLYPLNFWVAYCFVKAMQERVLIHLEYLITRFAAISLAIWSANILTGGAVQQALHGFSVGQPYASIVDSYILVQSFINEHVESFLPRNSGFAWEPGAFAVLCCLGLMANFYRTGFALKRNPAAWVLLAALVSSQSTTGFSILMILIVFKLWHDIPGAARLVLFPAAAAAVVVGLISLPFMQSKIEELWAQNLNDLAYSASQDWNVAEPLAAQRFLSFQLDFSDYLRYPMTGYGGEDDAMLVRQDALNIVSISGIGKIFARFGTFGFAFFAWATVTSSRSLSRKFGAGSPVMLTLYIFMVSVSYSLIEHPVFLALWCFAFFGGEAEARSERPKMVAVS
ncbi:hypothetical protein [Oryzibacter oryziterrae]|uniref:hypothetical protein n=1 Tax=Oryzibacter oryziterrae TaxID=2766474 RepID=UPI001F3BFF8D|nr:hypothetical protein [Oryzibacter oryziterrae]